MKPGAIAAVVVAVLVAVGVFAFVASDDSSDDSVATTTVQQTTDTNASETSQPADNIEDATDQLLKADEVATHNSESDCWTIISGDVYDITDYVPRHPGGDEVLRACGTDGTSLFEQRTTADGEEVGSGSPHSSRAASQLADFKVGTLDTTAE